MKSSEITATIFIPTWFGDKYLDELLASVFSQKCDFLFEVLIYDSCSKDNTLAIIKKYINKHNNLRFKSINKKNFNHGLTRQRAALDAYGKYIVYLTQDAIPANNMWLSEIIKPFKLNKKIVAVLGSQQPRNTAPPFLKREINSVFNNLGNDLSTSLYYKDKKFADSLEFLGFYSDVNSATIKNFLLNTIPYRKADYAEDQIFGREIIQAGYIKAYNPRAKVIHSNDFTASEYTKRVFDETIALKRIGPILSTLKLGYVLKDLVKNIIIDSITIIINPEYNFKNKLHWLIFNPIYLINKWIGYYQAMRTTLGDSQKIKKYSLEKNKNN